MSDDATPFELLPNEEVERLLPAYSEISFLAKGGMAAVYRGVQTSLERPVAIKILPREFGTDEAFRLRFVAEGKAMARLNHPNLVGIFDFGQVDDLLYLVMEFVDGQTLYEHAYGSPMEELKAIDLCYRVADGLAHAHEHGILHRDIKPANVLLDQALSPKLGDFGLAEGEEREEGDDLIFGTPGYTSPEVMADPTAADEKADIYAVGVMLYELLTTAIPSEPYQSPSQLAKTDPRIDAVIAKAIRTDPAYRHASARELADSLKALYDQMKAAPRRKLATGAPAANSARTLKVEKAPPREFPKPAPVLATGEEEATASPAPRPPSQSSQSSANFTLIRNLIIIAFLAAAIFAVWKAKDAKEDRIAAQQAKQEEKQARQKRKKDAENRRAQVEREAALAANEGAGSQGTPSQGTQTPSQPKVEQPSPLTPREQLEELRLALASGERDRFPEGSLQRGSSRYFFIEEPLTWYRAIEFAEGHGAQLAMVSNKSDLRWLAKEIPNDDDIWMGAGAIARGTWAWFDEGKDFDLKPPSSSTKVAGMMTNAGIFKAGHPSEKHSFFLQWDSDGKHAGSREKDFTTLAETIQSADPIWPPGIRSYKDRRYLTIARELSQAEAASIAAQAGGTLAVPSDDLEASFLKDYVAESGLQTLWLGGEKRKNGWAWKTNESWQFANWNEGFPLDDQDATGLQIDSEGWLNTDPFASAPGFIIEWSDDAKDAPPAEASATSGGRQELDELRARAKRFLAKEKSDADKKLKANLTAQGMSMRQWLRNIPREQAERYKKIYESYTDRVRSGGNRLPEPSTTIVASTSEEAAKILTRYYRAQSQEDEKMLSSAERVRASYASKLEGLLEKMRAKGLNTQIGHLKEETENIGTTGASFLKHLKIDYALENKAVSSAPFVSKATYSKKKVDVTKVVRRLLAEQDSFRVLVSDLEIGPEPYVNKSLHITWTMNSKTYSRRYSKGSQISLETLKAHAAIEDAQEK